MVADADRDEREEDGEFDKVRKAAMRAESSEKPRSEVHDEMSPDGEGQA